MQSLLKNRQTLDHSSGKHFHTFKKIEKRRHDIERLFAISLTLLLKS